MSQLERSLLLLDESVVKSKRGLLRAKDRPQLDESTAATMDFDLSVTVGPQEIRSFMLDGNLSGSRMSLAGSVASVTGTNVKNRADALFGQFLEVLQRRSSESEVFETVEDLIETLDEALGGIVKVTGQAAGGGRERKVLAEESWLTVERDTWKLLFALYKDRLVVQKEELEVDDLPLVNSERAIVEHLYAANANLREYQLIVDWLEQTALEQNRMQIGHFTDRTIAWENTLHQLQNVGFTAFGSSREIVKSLDPDAPARERRPLHDLDQEDQARLSRQIFQEIRFGRIEDAQNLCEHCGQPWRAAILEGWRLHHDPNYEPAAATFGTGLVANLKQAIEGNPRRDLWKKLAWKMAESRTVDEYSRAMIGAFCGHLDALLAVLNDHSWPDVLWAYLKVQIDIRVESEIRSHCVKSYLPMPEKYWNNKMSLEQIFEELEAHKNPRIKTTARDVDRVIQKYLILDDIPELMRQIDNWLADPSFPLTAQIVRFLTHLILFIRQIGKQCQEDIGDRVIKRYVECLIRFGDPQLVAFYTAALPADLQLLMYSNFLETIKESAARKRALEEAYSFGLDVPAITVYTVEKVRNREEEDADVKPQEGDLTPLDQLKISALEWLVFYPDQRGELLWQTNALMRAFLAKRNVEAARKAFAVVPADTIQQIINAYGSKDELPHKEEVSIKEYLCHQTYLAAIDGYNDWVEYYYNMKPKQPQLVKSSNFTERIASEHREQTYRMDLERWHAQLQEQTTVTRDLLYNILLFPERGWLVDPENGVEGGKEGIVEEDWRHRTVQMENLRKLCVPDVVLLLHQIFTLSGRYAESLQLADVIGSEQRQLYKLYSKHKLAEVMSKIAESSLALMNGKLDPFVGEEGKKK